MSEISDKIIKSYRENIVIRDVKFYRECCWDILIIKITDNNKKHFKNKTLREEVYYKTKTGLNLYIERIINDYIDKKIGDKIRVLESYQIIQEYKKDLLEEKGE